MCVFEPVADSTLVVVVRRAAVFAAALHGAAAACVARLHGVTACMSVIPSTLNR
jgi:hypothetical protein